MAVAKYWDGAAWKVVGLRPARRAELRAGHRRTARRAASSSPQLRDSRYVSVAVVPHRRAVDEVEVDVERTDLNLITVRTFPYVPAVGELTVVVAAPGTQATLNITMDGWHQVGAAGEPAFQNGWAN